MPIFYKQGEYYLLLTKRTEKVKDHKGQISFPGGAYQGGDAALIDTALRETTEEIGLAADAVEVLGALDDTITVASNYVISPFVALVPWPYQFRIDEDEVEEIVEIPISVLLEDDSSHHQTGGREGNEIDGYRYYYQGNVIWGATARILNQFLDIYIRVIQDR